MGKRVAPRQPRHDPPGRWPPHWPTDATLDTLERRSPRLFYALQKVFGRRRAGQVIFNIMLKRPKAEGKERR